MARTGTSGHIGWRATSWKWVDGSSVSPSSITIAAGQSASASLRVTAPSTAGDTSESVVVGNGAKITTIPVTIRTLVGTTSSGGTFTGVLTGGNGRGAIGGGLFAPGVENTYVFNVPRGEQTLNVDVHLASNPSNGLELGTQLIAYLIDPSGNSVAYSTNYTTSSSSSTSPEVVQDVSVYHARPAAGMWRVVLEWPNPVSGAPLSVPFSGTVTFNLNGFDETNNLPSSTATKVSATSGRAFSVHLCNPSKAPQAFFADARLRHAGSASYPLANLLNGGSTAVAQGATGVPGAELIYLVPPDTTQLQSSLLSSVPVTYDLFSFTGDPDISPAVHAPGVSGSQFGGAASVTYTNSEVGQGLWGMSTDEVGPFPASGALPAPAQANVAVTTQPFDDSITSSTGNLWPGATLTESPGSFSPQYLAASACADITGTIKPAAIVPGTVVHGTLYIDDYVLGADITSGFVPSDFGLGILPSGDQIIAIPYTYTVSH